MTTASYVAAGARLKANDPSGARFTDAMALRWINDGILQTVIKVPRAYPTRSTVTPTGTGIQTLSSLGVTNALQLIDLGCNVAVDGVTRGRRISRRSSAQMDSMNPMWRSEGGTEALHYVFDEQEPRQFELYPYLTGGRKVELVYSTRPAELTALSQTIPLGDQYLPALEAYVLFSYYSSATSTAYNPQLAGSFLTLFGNALGNNEEAVNRASVAATQRSN